MFADDANTCDGRTGVECHQPQALRLIPRSVLTVYLESAGQLE